MIFDNESRARLIVTVTTDFDPATATVEVAVDNVWYPADWSTAATTTTSATGTRWKRVAVTSGYFRGPDATGTGAILTVGRHLTKTRVTVAGEVIAYDSTPVDVR